MIRYGQEYCGVKTKSDEVTYIYKCAYKSLEKDILGYYTMTTAIKMRFQWKF